VNNSRRGEVFATARQCLWKRALVVIGPLLPKRDILPFQAGWMLRLFATCGRAGGGQVSAKSEMEPGPRPASSVRCITANNNPQKTRFWRPGKTLVLPYYKITLLEISSVSSSMAPMQSWLPFLVAQLFAMALLSSSSLSQRSDFATSRPARLD
jgi:hypothetical protein